MMSNPYTRHLSRGLEDEELKRFIAYWDRLEGLVIAVYKQGSANAEDEAEYEEIRQQLASSYEVVREELEPLTKQVRTGSGELCPDVFADLLVAVNAATFVGNWRAMQQLPAAREALNRYLVGRSQETG